MYTFISYPSDIKKMAGLFTQFRKLRKKEAEARKARKNIKAIIQQQVRLYDKILKQYEFFELDADINGERVKKISKALGEKAKKEMIDPKLLEKIKKSERWTFDW